MRIIATTKWWDVATFALFSEPITFTSRHFLPLLLPVEVDILANVSSLNSNCCMPDNFFWGGIHIIGRLRHKCSAYGSKGQALNCQNALQKAKLHFPCEIPPGPSNFVACTHMFVVLGHITAATRRQVLSVRPIYCHCSVITGFTSHHSITHCLSHFEGRAAIFKPCRIRNWWFRSYFHIYWYPE